MKITYLVKSFWAELSVFRTKCNFYYNFQKIEWKWMNLKKQIYPFTYHLSLIYGITLAAGPFAHCRPEALGR